MRTTSRLVLQAVLALLLLCAGNAVSTAAKLNPAKHSVADLTKISEEKTLKEGENAVYTAPDGYTITAVVRSGKLARYVVKDDKGRDVKTTSYRRKVGMTVRCWHCYRSKDGTINCFEIKCPF